MSEVKLNPLIQPRAFYLIFTIELWERFGFYGLQAVMTVYLVKKLGLSEADSFTLFSSFVALAYGLVSAGGWLGDKILGFQRVILLGAVVLMIGYAFVTVSAEHPFLLFLGMGTIATGNGLFKANPSALLSKCYSKDDSRLDGAFTMYYMAINIGTTISMLATPWLAVEYGYTHAFGLSVVGMFLTTFNFLLMRRWVTDYGSDADFKTPAVSTWFCVLIGVGLSCGVSTLLLKNANITSWLMLVLSIIVLYLYLKETFSVEGVVRRKMFVSLALMLQAVVFFTLYNQMPMSLNFFAIKNVSHDIFGFAVQPEQFQTLNPVWIMIASPFLAVVYTKIGNRLPMAHKFVIGMFLCSLAFLVIALSVRFANEEGIVSSNWLVIYYLLQSIGELLISGLGLSMVAQLVPTRLVGFIMGVWWLAPAAASVTAGWVSNLTATPKSIIDPNITLEIYGHVFMQIGVVTLGIAILMALVAPWLHRLTQDKREEPMQEVPAIFPN